MCSSRCFNPPFTTANSVIQTLLGSNVREERMNLAVRQMVAASPEDRRTYREETAEWDVVANDGLGDW